MNLKSQTSISSSSQSTESQDGRLPLNRYVLFFVLLVIGLSADLISKTLIFNSFYDASGAYQAPYWLIDSFFGIQCSTNPGALFGMGKGLSWLFASVSVVAIVALIVWLFVFKAAVDFWLTFILGMISGGILGNFYDRIGLGWRPEYSPDVKTDVRDWIHVYIEGVPGCTPWPNFNIADSLLVTGAMLLLLHAFFQKDPNAQPKENDSLNRSEPDPAIEPTVESQS